MVWKMSIDLKRVLVPSMGQHDPADACVTYLEVAGATPVLEREIGDARELCMAARWESEDPLGIGSLLVLIHRLAVRIGCHGEWERAMLAQLLAAARLSLEVFAREGALNAPAHYRLAFRELGLAIGLHAIERMPDFAAADAAVSQSLAALRSHISLGRRIDDFWTESRHRRSTAWTEHQHINDVMLATSLLPEGYLGYHGPKHRGNAALNSGN